MKTYLIASALLISSTVWAQQAAFDNFFYKGEDVCFAKETEKSERYNPVSYTHLTLPTNREV